MSKSDLTTTERSRRARVLESALKAGYPPPGQRAKNRHGAISEAAIKLGLARGTISSWLGFEERNKKAGKHFIIPDWSLYAPDETAHQTSTKAPLAQLTGSPESRRIIELEDETRRLRSELRAAHRDALEEDAIRKLIGNLSTAPTMPPDWLIKPSRKANSSEVPMMIWSDWHLGEVVSLEETGGVNEYNPQIAESRIKQLISSTIDLSDNHGPGKYPGAVVNMLGDFISGGLHPELLRTDADGVMQAVVRARDLLVWSLDQMIERFGKVFCPCAAGNHGRNTSKPEYKGYLHHNFDWLIYQFLIRHYANDKRITFMVPSSNECYYQVYGKRYLAMHGDMLGVKGGDGIIGSIGPIMRGEFKTRGQSSVTDRVYDYLLMGHYHQELWLPRAIVANSIKGFDEYVKNALRAMPSEPSQPLWFVHPQRGITSRWNVQVNPKSNPMKSQWLTWEDGA